MLAVPHSGCELSLKAGFSLAASSEQNAGEILFILLLYEVFLDFFRQRLCHIISGICLHVEFSTWQWALVVEKLGLIYLHILSI